MSTSLYSWAFSALASLETAWAIKTAAEPVSLSEQQLVSCAHTTGNHGCQGGLRESAFTSLVNNGGACSSEEYPYTSGLVPPASVSASGSTGSATTVGDGPSERDGACRPCTVVAKPRGFTALPENDEAALMRAVDRGVVSVAVHAGNPKFQFAGEGVFGDEDCGTELDHGMAVVGYGTEGGEPYWLVRQSWGDKWGDKGYIKMKRGVGATGICGIAMMASTVEV